MIFPRSLLPFAVALLEASAARSLAARSLAALVDRSNTPRSSFYGGFALVSDTCPSGTSICDSRACCPTGTTCQKSNNVQFEWNAHCCPSDTDCYNTLETAPICADPSWLLYNITSTLLVNAGYFCCAPGYQGLNPTGSNGGNGGQDFGSCVPSDTNVAASAKAALISGTLGPPPTVVMSTGAASATSSSKESPTTVSASQSTLSVSPPTLSGSSPNSPSSSSTTSPNAAASPKSSSKQSSGLSAGAIGGIVGGVVLLAVGSLALFFILRQKKSYERKLAAATASASSGYVKPGEEVPAGARPTELDVKQPTYELGEVR
ncbi:hypothetical protein K432DRAFT_410112 [Lepidopterella palustris CBS 459.81]|uniref:Mid2 domain-containing protein n=1 Tax=Lepidopterella palustris CBS 459.81 TaxID=1314670 RepID=A0A8E2J9C4_9PEZI|nr:hypothetical protein K432DRAFT_410112 [Lepidopterella palustris CBS 459.81]